MGATCAPLGMFSYSLIPLLWLIPVYCQMRQRSFKSDLIETIYNSNRYLDDIPWSN